MIKFDEFYLLLANGIVGSVDNQKTSFGLHVISSLVWSEWVSDKKSEILI